MAEGGDQPGARVHSAYPCRGRSRASLSLQRRPAGSGAGFAAIAAAAASPAAAASARGLEPERAYTQARTAALARPGGAAALGVAGAVAGAAAGVAGKAAWATVSLVLVHAAPGCAHLVGAAALWSRARLFGMPLPGGGRFGLALLQPLRASMLALGVARAVLPPLAPSLWRSIRYWRRIMPIFARYLWTSYRAKALRRAGKPAEADALWEKRHQAGAEEIHSMLTDLRGFYLKLGQIIATKTDMLGPVYTEVLGKLHDQMPYVPVKQVRRLLTKELERPSKKVFRWVDDVPLASATIGQVHRATLRGGGKVVIKVQHKGVERMMRSDLRNMRLFMEVLELSPLDLGFDMLSIIREYQEVVPYEFDFAREGKMQTLLRQHLRGSGSESEMIIPKVNLELTTRKVLVMEHLDGIPILDIRHMEAQVDKVELMTKLVRSFGLMVLRDGIFHTDPHPGNLLALYNPTTQQMAVGLLDFGQVKELSAQGQQDFAKLCLALASRDPARVRETMAEVGLDIRGCSPEFQAAAGHILFDTRMDFPEAWMSPFDEAAVEFRKTIVKVFPQELFMIMRVMTLFRGILGSLEVDVSSALLWKDLAEDVVEGRAGIKASRNIKSAVKRRPSKKKVQITHNMPHHMGSQLPAGGGMAAGSPPGYQDQELETPHATVSGVTGSWESQQVQPDDLSYPAGAASPGLAGSDSGPASPGSEPSSLCPSLRDLSLTEDPEHSNLHDLRAMLSESRRESLNGSEGHAEQSLDELIAAMPSLPHIRTGHMANHTASHGSTESQSVSSLGNGLKPFGEMQQAAAVNDRVGQLKAGDGFTFSPVKASNPFAQASRSMSNATRSYDSSMAGVTGAQAHANLPSVQQADDGASLVRKQINAGAGAPPMHYTVKLSDV